MAITTPAIISVKARASCPVELPALLGPSGLLEPSEPVALSTVRLDEPTLAKLPLLPEYAAVTVTVPADEPLTETVQVP